MTSYPKIVISVTAGFRKVVAQQMEWVCIRLGGQWEERVVVSLDKVLISNCKVPQPPHLTPIRYIHTQHITPRHVARVYDCLGKRAKADFS